MIQRAVPAELTVNKVSFGDLGASLAKGVRDFNALPSYGVFLVLLWPLIGWLLIRLAVFDLPLMSALYPLGAGFALLGPFVAIALCELSRRRELGLDLSAAYILEILDRSRVVSLACFGFLLLGIFLLWLLAAEAMLFFQMESRAPMALGALMPFGIAAGMDWNLIWIGSGIGLVFSALMFCIGVVSIPLMLDRNVSAGDAARLSLRVVAANPVLMAVWAVVVAALLALGLLLFFVGLIVILPVLAHAGWHLYRSAIADGTKTQEMPKG